MFKKPRRSSLKCYFWLLRQLLKYQNSRITSRMEMKLGPDMYHLNTFHIHRNEGGIELARGRGIQKTIEKCHKISINVALTWPNNSLKKAMYVGVFFTIILNHLALLLQGDTGGRQGGEAGLNPIWGVLVTSRSSRKWYFLLLTELLKDQNSRITCRM